jgi:hypothetical protein
MGKVKQLFTQSWEEKLLRDENRSGGSRGSRGSRQLELFPDDQARAQYEAEFNAWLDAYEKSFGDEEGKLP